MIDGQEIESLLGQSVESSAGEDMGHIVDVLADKQGQLRAAVIDFGGFFGVGSRKIAVDWRTLRFMSDGKSDRIVVDLPKNELKNAPPYTAGEPVVVLGPVQPAAAGTGAAQPGAASAPASAASTQPTAPAKP